MRVLVTGANGFIGRALCRSLTESGTEVTAVVRSDVPVRFGTKLVLDIMCEENSGELTRALTGVDSVVHTIGLTHAEAQASSGAESQFEKTNIKITSLLAQACKEAKIEMLVYLSSVKAAAEMSPISPDGQSLPITETMTPQPAGLYGQSKLRAEQALIEILAQSTTRGVIIRPPLVYGVGQKGNMATLFSAVKLGLPLPFADTSNHRSIIAVDNLCDAIKTVLNRGASRSNVYYVADECLSTAALVKRIADALGVKARLLRCPEIILKFLTKSRRFGDRCQKLFGSLIVDDTKFRAEFDWQPPVSPADVFKAIAESSR